MWHEDYAEHDSGGDHPEASDRVAVAVEHLRRSDLWPRLTVVRPEPASVDDILRVHDQGYVDEIRRAAESGGHWIDPDTHVSPESYDVALLAAGGAIQTTRLWDQGLVSFALVRPPGHHATAATGDGLLPLQQRRHRRRHALADGYERIAHRRLGRASRQRHARRSSTTIRACCSSRLISRRTIRGREP